MRFENAVLPVGGWSSPFARWQGALADVSSLDLATVVTQAALEARGVEIGDVSKLVLGWTVPQHRLFFGAPVLGARLGAAALTGPMVSQACATGVAALQLAALEVAQDPASRVLVVCTDRTSNGPLVVYPTGRSPGGTPLTESWVTDNFSCDPCTGEGMLETAEAVASEEGYGREELDEVTLLRYEQYRAATAGHTGIRASFLVPVVVPGRRGELRLEDDEGVHDTTAEALASLAPLTATGVVTFGSQTHPADGCSGVLVEAAGRRERGRAEVRLLSTGWARVERGRMPKAPVAAAGAALADAGIGIDQIDVVTTHNPFAVNDLYFARTTGFPLERMNQLGCSLVYGHPQAPTGLRGIAELIALLEERGGGLGLFTGCAAGDTGAAAVFSVGDAAAGRA